MKKLFFILGLIVIVSLNAILILGGRIDIFDKVEKAFEVAVTVLEFSIIPTAIYFLVKTIILKNKVFAWLFGVINLCYIVAWTMYFMGIEMPKILLYIFDVYALNLYLIFYIINWKKLSSGQF